MNRVFFCTSSLLLSLWIQGAGCAGGGGSHSAVEPTAGSHVRATDADARTSFTSPPLPPPSDRRLASGAPGPAYWQQRADYTIDATLDAEKREITASETIVYHNNSPHELRCLWFNLEQNLFRPGSDGALITRPSARFGNRDRAPAPEGYAGGFTLTQVAIDQLIVKMHEFGTIGRVDLATPLAPGGTATITIGWTFPIPKYGSDRMGIDEVKDGPIFEIAQWFPNVCVYDDVHGWNTLPYLGQGEFYTNFGDYKVSITVPASHVVAATGELDNAQDVLTPEQYERLGRARQTPTTVPIRTEDDIDKDRNAPAAGGATRTWRFTAKNVRTFAFASSPAFCWDACTCRVPQRAPEPDAVLCQAFYPREAKAAWARSLKGAGAGTHGAVQFLRASIEHYSRMWMPYPYSTATNVNGIVGGMEYPTIVFCGAREDSRALWGVTTHEIGHTWFPMVLSSDERRHAWMDEGLDTFINYYATRERYPETEPHRGGPARWARAQPKSIWQPIVTPADQYAPGMLSTLAYDKTATGLVLLRETILGPERFDPAFREYCRRWAFKHPQPADFFRTIEDAAGVDLGWFWRSWFYGTGTLDQAVTAVLQPSPAAGESGGAADKGFARITFVHRGGPGRVIMPVLYKLTLDDGTSEDRRVPVEGFFTSDTFTAVVDTRGRAVRVVEIDPDERMPDVDRTNNSWKR